MSFDEMNVVRISKELKTAYNDLMNFNKEEYKKIVREARLYAISLLTDEQKKQSKKREKLTEQECEEIVEYVFTHYNPITGYLYKAEAERKRLRQGEEMATAREMKDRKRYDKVLRRSANLWYTQSGQYAIDMEDNMVLKTFKDFGIKKVRWVSEHDDKTCKVCKKLDGKIFDIDKVPPKQHYNCRCYIVPYT